ncbi:MAG: hypothetical protein JWR80_9518 [Bradyrhizobium sp.]|nr:hypothetical protein [Bradyrhizobium sp.]
MTGQTVRLVGDTQRAYAKRLIDEAEAGYIVQIGAPTRTLDQNAKMHPMIEDIKRQVPAMATFTVEQIKLRFLDALGTELTFLPKLEGEGLFPVGLRSSTLTKGQFSGLIELLYQFGAKYGVRWSEPAERKDA